MAFFMSLMTGAIKNLGRCRHFGTFSALYSSPTPGTESQGSDVEGFVNLLRQVEENKSETPTAADITSKCRTLKATTQPSFHDLLRSSKFIHMGDIEGRTVVGVITNAVADDLYIDFGGKFQCVCKRPNIKKNMYKKGVQVYLRLLDFEMTSYFMGASKDLTLLEADAVLLGLVGDSSPTAQLGAKMTKNE